MSHSFNFGETLQISKIYVPIQLSSTTSWIITLKCILYLYTYSTNMLSDFPDITDANKS